MAASVQIQVRKSKIESDKTLIKDLFTDFWFRIPEYQRSYVWTCDEVSELLNDVCYAAENHPESEYFLGSLVLQKQHTSNGGVDYDEHDVLDGQQRLTTLFMLMAVIRDITSVEDLKKMCSNFIFRKGNEFIKQPERMRLTYKIRDSVGGFMDAFVKEEGGTLKSDQLLELSQQKNVSIAHMSSAILTLKKYFESLSGQEVARFATFLFNNVLVIYVSSDDLEDAFRLFTILNARGLPLTNSDILKAQNLGAIVDDREKNRYASLWEDMEGSLGQDEFERLLSYIRTIYLKDKARENILKEFEEKIYGANPPLLRKGKETFGQVKEYADIYHKLIYFEGTPPEIDNQFKNLIQIMWAGLPSTDWIPPLLFFYKKFGTKDLLLFARKLDNKFSGDWISQETPTTRIVNMGSILKAIEKAKDPKKVTADTTIFSFDLDNINFKLDTDVYNRRYGKYLLLKLEYLYQDHTHLFPVFGQISVEHILPQQPDTDSEWAQTFTQKEHNKLVNSLGNLILISRRKNSSLSNRDFASKKKTYFSDYVSVFPNSVRVMHYNEWTPAIIKKRYEELNQRLGAYYRDPILK